MTRFDVTSTSEPDATRGCTLSLCAVFALAALYTSSLAPLGLNLYDEGVRLYGASQVLAGTLPYFDFFAYYGPAQFYWPALLFKLFGTEIIVARLGAVVFICLAACAVFALGRHAGLSRWWAATPTAALIVPLRSGSHLTTCDPALSLVLAAGAALIGAWGGRRRTFLAGILLGLALTFRHDFGLYGASAAAILLFWRRRPAPTEARHGAPAARWLVPSTRPLCALFGGIASVVLPTYGLLALYGPQRLLAALLVEPARLMPFRTLPYAYYEVPLLHAWGHGLGAAPRSLADPSTLAIFVTPPLALGLSLRLLSQSERHRLSSPPARIEILLFALVTAVGLAVYALGRSDWYHVYPLHIFSVLVASLILGRRVSSAGPLGLVVAVIAVATFRVVLVASGATVATPLSIPHTKGVSVSADQAWVSDAVHDISRFGSGGPIFVAAPRHDRVHTNALLLYFLSGRPSGTYFHDIIPGLTTTGRVQEHIINDLTRSRVKTVVIWKSPLPDEPNRSRVPSGVFVLDNYLRSEFSRVRETENYDILIKRD